MRQREYILILKFSFLKRIILCIGNIKMITKAPTRQQQQQQAYHNYVFLCSINSRLVEV